MADTPHGGWRDIESAPRHPRDAGHSYGPLVWVLIPYTPPEADIGWWDRHAKCWRFTGDDGPDDIQPIKWAPLPAPPETENG